VHGKISGLLCLRIDRVATASPETTAGYSSALIFRKFSVLCSKAVSCCFRVIFCTKSAHLRSSWLILRAKDGLHFKVGRACWLISIWQMCWTALMIASRYCGDMQFMRVRSDFSVNWHSSTTNSALWCMKIWAVAETIHTGWLHFLTKTFTQLVAQNIFNTDWYLFSWHHKLHQGPKTALHLLYPETCS